MYWYGIDLHSTNFIVVRLDKDDRAKVYKFKLNKFDIEDFKRMLKPEDKLAFEMSTNGFWFYDQVKDCVKECVVVNPKKFSVIYKSTSKTDKKDAKLIAKFLKNNLLPSVYVPEEPIRELRSLFSSYEMTMKIKVMGRNRVHSLTKQTGRKISRSEINLSLNEKIQNWDMPEVIKHQIHFFIDQIEYAKGQLEKLENEIYLTGEAYKELIEILISEPGISALTAMAVIADIGDIERFPNAKKLVSYLGCAPWVNSSNNKTYIGEFHKEARKYTKTRMVQCIRHFCNHSKRVNDFFQEKTKGKHKNVVRIAIIRKKIVGFYYMLNRNQYSRYRDAELHKKKMIQYELKLNQLKMEAA